MKLLSYTLAALLLALALTFVQTRKMKMSKNMDINQISRTIKSRYRKVYGTFNSPRMVKNFKELVTAVQQLSGSGEKQLVGFRALETEMKTRGLQNSIQVIQLYARLQSTQGLRNQRAKRGIEAIRNRLASNVRRLINKWASGILAKQHISYIDAIRLSKSDPDAMEAVTFDLITKAYGSKLDRFERCTSFLRSAFHPKVQMAGYYALALDMFNKGQFNSPEVFQLAVGVKKIGSSRFRSAKLSKKGVEHMQWIVGKLPKNVIQIAFNGKACTIKNDHFKTFLYADPESFDAKHRYEFLWARPSEVKKGVYWNFAQKGWGKTWYISNLGGNSTASPKVEGQDLIAETSSMNTHTSRRRTFIWRVMENRPETGQWSLAPLQDGTITIRNIHWNYEYLYADGKYIKDTNRRNLFTWQNGKPQGKMWLESKWHVACYGNPNS